MFFELQLSSKVFGQIVRNRIRAIPLCIDQEFDFEGTRYVIDHVDIIDSITVSKQTVPTQITWIFSLQNYTFFTVPYLQVKQGVTVRLVKGSDLEQNGPKRASLQKSLLFFRFLMFQCRLLQHRPGREDLYRYGTL